MRRLQRIRPEGIAEASGRPGTILRRAGLPAAALLLVFGPGSAVADDADCLRCHTTLTRNKPVVHAALPMGCLPCHGDITDAQTIPHGKAADGKTGPAPDQARICYGCHDRSKFSGNTVHPALAMGCTPCHHPHASAHAKLLRADVPALCFTCHDKAAFSRKNVHPPVAGGMCLSCHAPHASDTYGILLKPPVELCSECHPAVAQAPHAIAGIGQSGHSVGLPKKDRKGKELAPPDDPRRPDRPFTCASCHDPHSSDHRRLFRYAARSQMELCIHCHHY